MTASKAPKTETRWKIEGETIKAVQVRETSHYLTVYPADADSYLRRYYRGTWMTRGFYRTFREAKKVLIQRALQQVRYHKRQAAQARKQIPLAERYVKRVRALTAPKKVEG